MLLYLDISLTQGLGEHGHDLALLPEQEHVFGAFRDHVQHGGDGLAGPVDDLGLQAGVPDHVQLPVPVYFVPLRPRTNVMSAT